MLTDNPGCIANWVFDIELALAFQDEDGHGRKLLVSEASRKRVCGVLGIFCVAICQSVTLAEQHLALAGNEHRACKKGIAWHRSVSIASIPEITSGEMAAAGVLPPVNGGRRETRRRWRAAVAVGEPTWASG